MNHSDTLIYAQLAVSRERLRQALGAASQATGTHASGGGGTPAGASSIPAWLMAVLQTPNPDMVRTLVTAWWAQHPWRTAAGAAVGVAQGALAPIAQRNPMALVSAAVGVGAVLVLVKPWRWTALLPMVLGCVPPLLARTAAPASTPELPPWAAALLGVLLRTKP
ncbi:hypothetical protein [Rhodoferax aquaticus]|uniref:Uncharacterized protein n=1 Tax=Rhodoferax aquaticus TaxID=2527691 RepID=A0A515EUC8_9BURK|nr:hypothetical protein [Rhodoferax aquaticus]QDL56282.1 hypothetical protein EXZ61_20155 [Rhodoferax aquaticus]